MNVIQSVPVNTWPRLPTFPFPSPTPKHQTSSTPTLALLYYVYFVAFSGDFPCFILFLFFCFVMFFFGCYVMFWVTGPLYCLYSLLFT